LLSERATGQLVLATLKDPTVIVAPLATSLASTLLRSDLYAVLSSILYAFPLVLRVMSLIPAVLEIKNALVTSTEVKGGMVGALLGALVGAALFSGQAAPDRMRIEEVGYSCFMRHWK